MPIGEGERERNGMDMLPGGRAPIMGSLFDKIEDHYNALRILFNVSKSYLCIDFQEIS